jgi:hypothetical protein
MRTTVSALLALFGASLAPSSHEPLVIERVQAKADLSADNGVLVDLQNSSWAAGPSGDLREVFVDPEALGLADLPGGTILRYDYHTVTRQLSGTELLFEDELSLAVRLIISEVGADRLLANRYGLLEAIGILYTVDNRLEWEVYNPLDQPKAPAYEGCGPDGEFATCANPEQYLGMATWRALDPSSRYRPELLEAAVDRAVLAWWLQETRLVEDFTSGATVYVHRCGGAAYGLTTHHCDRHLGRPKRDVPGANPFTGPLVFRAPEAWLPRRGFYSLYISGVVDWQPIWQVQPESQDGLAMMEAEPKEDLNGVLWEDLPEESVRERLQQVYGQSSDRGGPPRRPSRGQ